MKKWLLILSWGVFAIPTFAQQQDLSTLGCATITTEEEMQDLKSFIDAGLPQSKTTADKDTIPITVHIVGNNNGSGFYKLQQLFHVICNTNNHFAPTGFYFYIKWPIRYIKNTNYNVHNYNSGAQMMASNNVANTVNIYFVQDPSGACGYYTYGQDAIAIAKSCAGNNSTTVTHEIGHYMGLPHTFYGWENGNTPNNPERVTRGVGANCNNTGDLFCDTEADYLGYRWQCPYSGNKLDNFGDVYHPDSSIFMSYSTDACMTRFSDQQKQRMRNRLAQRSNLLQNTPSFGIISDSAHVVYPIDTMYANMKVVKWNSVPGADRYYVRVYPTFWPSNGLVDTMIADTTIAFSPNVANNYPCTYEIVPLNGANVCMDFRRKGEFIYSLNTASSIGQLNVGQAEMKVMPNPIQQGTVQVEITVSQNAAMEYQLLSISGQQLLNGYKKLIAGINSVSIPVPHLTPGIYFLKVETADWKRVEKVVVQ